jgi:hypothetical protein
MSGVSLAISTRGENAYSASAYLAGIALNYRYVALIPTCGVSIAIGRIYNRSATAGQTLGVYTTNLANAGNVAPLVADPAGVLDFAGNAYYDAAGNAIVNGWSLNPATVQQLVQRKNVQFYNGNRINNPVSAFLYEVTTGPFTAGFAWIDPNSFDDYGNLPIVVTNETKDFSGSLVDIPVVILVGNNAGDPTNVIAEWTFA